MTPEEMTAHGIVPCAYGFEADPTFRVEWRGGDRWAIVRGNANYNRYGEWEVEPMNTWRTDDYLERCRYTLDEALEQGLNIIEQGANRC